MSQWDYFHEYEWWAWFPVKTTTGWVWLERVKVEYDERPEVYHGMCPTTTYYKLNKK